MRPIPLALAAILCLAAVPSRAQDAKSAPAKSAPPAEAAAPARSPATAPAPSAASPQDAFWLWFIGPATGKGAYKASGLTCKTIHDLNNEAARGRQRVIGYDGHRYALSFLLSVGAQDGLCKYTDAGGLPPDTVLPLVPTAWAEWLRSNAVADKAFKDMLGYYDAAEQGAFVKNEKSAAEIVAKLRSNRAAFWTESAKVALADDTFRVYVCGKLELGANCASTIQTLTVDELYAAGRKP